MAYSTKNMLEEFETLVLEEDWQPTTAEIKEHFYPKDKRKQMDELRREHLTRLLIGRLRHRLKHQSPSLYFYNVGGRYKVLASYEERQEITGRLWNITNGFSKATTELVDDTVASYPELMNNPFWIGVKGKLDALRSLAELITGEIDAQIQKALESGEAQNKHELREHNED